MNTSTKRILLTAVGASAALMGTSAHALGLADLTATVDLSAISTAMTVVFSGMITVGIFMKGGAIISKKLGWG